MNRKAFYILEKRLILSIICSKCEVNNDKTSKKEKGIEILKVRGLNK